MFPKTKLLAIASVLAPILTAAQTPAPASAAAVWNALSAPAMDPAKSAHVENVMKEALGQWRKEKELIRKKDALGHSRGSLGPFLMGLRIRSTQSGPFAYQDLVYSKGA